MHHWPDRARGLAELARVARERVVIVTWDPATRGFWLVDDVRPVLVPHDCVDGFLGAYWRRPAAYLDAGVRGAISTFARLADVESGLARLAADLASGAWERRHGHLRARDAFDLGYRLVVAERRPSTIAERRSSTIAERR